MKVLFLDIDGVLNTKKTFLERRKFYKKTGIIKLEIDEYRIQYLKEILERTNSKLVLSSSWRMFYKKDNDIFISKIKRGNQLLELFKKYNIYIYDITPYIKGIRGIEIFDWYLKHNVDKFIVIDDEISDMNIIDKKNIIKVKKGLDLESTNKAIYLLNKKIK